MKKASGNNGITGATSEKKLNETKIFIKTMKRIRYEVKIPKCAFKNGFKNIYPIIFALSFVCQCDRHMKKTGMSW